jgi:chromosome segregation ATPase
MSTIDKQVRLAQLDRELYNKQADIAYKAFNGTKQSVRNFREGTLDIGKMNFDNTAQDRITKEMVTDFHKKEQERLDAQLKGKTETGLSSTIDTDLVNPVVQNFGTLGRPATSEDLEKKQEDIVKVVNEINRLDKIIRDAPKRINELELIKDKSKLKKLTPEWMNLQQPIMDLTREMRAAKTAMPKLEKQLTDLDTEMKLIETNIKDNEKEIINANITNKAVAKRYEDTFNALNQNLYSIKQEPHESEQAYIQRIKQLDTMKYDPKLFADKAELENSKQLMRNLKEVISDDGKISEIVKSLAPREIFDINKYWPKIKGTILNFHPILIF